jgi:hypothetical protein
MSRVCFTCLLVGWIALPAGVCLLSGSPSSAPPLPRPLDHTHHRHRDVPNHRLDSSAEKLGSAACHPCILIQKAHPSQPYLHFRCEKLGDAMAIQEYQSVGYVLYLNWCLDFRGGYLLRARTGWILWSSCSGRAGHQCGVVLRVTITLLLCIKASIITEFCRP